MVPTVALVERFSADLDAVSAREARIGVAVSGGPDSLALLLLAAAARPGQVEAATIDHGFRAEARDEADMVARVCASLDAIQERARKERYRLLGYWVEERGLRAVATAHHADDQAETLLMRLSRGAGVRGLAGMRPRSVTPGAHVRLIRPLLGWRRAELEQICADAGLTPATDPSNEDEKFERVRIRHTVAGASWLDAGAVARSARILADADAALDWAMKVEWDRSVQERREEIRYRRGDVPVEIVRRIVGRAVGKLASEGDRELRGPELDRLIANLSRGETATIRGVLCAGGPEWRFTPAPPRQAL
jgi:tRNA(Ile)-lysidine synthase